MAEGKADGSILLRSRQPLAEYPVSVVHSVREWARADPAHPMVAERVADGTGAWRTVSYGEAVAHADAIGEALLGLGLGAGRPLMMLRSASCLRLALGR